MKLRSLMTAVRVARCQSEPPDSSIGTRSSAPNGRLPAPESSRITPPPLGIEIDESGPARKQRNQMLCMGDVMTGRRSGTPARRQPHSLGRYLAVADNFDAVRDNRREQEPIYARARRGRFPSAGVRPAGERVTPDSIHKL
jgi:hypothetical protein